MGPPIINIGSMKLIFMMMNFVWQVSIPVYFTLTSVANVTNVTTVSHVTTISHVTSLTFINTKTFQSQIGYLLRFCITLVFDAPKIT